MRVSKISRKTAETDINMSLNPDGKGQANIDTGIGFINHMLTLFAAHGRFDIDIKCIGDIDVDCHHSIEDIGICLGQAFKEALSDKKGINRYADIILPMDEALILVALDISNRGYLSYETSIPSQKVGSFDTELIEEFWLAFVREFNITLHIKQLSGKNSHHIIEGMFKAVARALRKAVAINPDCADEIPSTKGVL